MPDEAFCKIRIRGLGNEWPLQCTSFAADSELRVKIISAIGAATSIRGFSALLMDPRLTARMNITDSTVFSSYTDYARCDKGYEIHRAKLRDSWWHMVAISRDPRLIPFLDENALWAKLKSTHFTTPLLRHWLPHIQQQLLQQTTRNDGKALQSCCNFRSKAAMIYADDAILDGIVSAGVRGHELYFEANHA